MSVIAGLTSVVHKCTEMAGFSEKFCCYFCANKEAYSGKMAVLLAACLSILGKHAAIPIFINNDNYLVCVFGKLITQSCHLCSMSSFKPYWTKYLFCLYSCHPFVTNPIRVISLESIPGQSQVFCCCMPKLRVLSNSNWNMCVRNMCVIGEVHQSLYS